MRYLNAIAAHELFVATGVYRRYAGGALSDYSESFTQHEHKGGALLVRIDQDARFTEGWSRLAEVLHEPDGTVARVKIQTNYNSTNSPFRMMKTDYSFFDDYVQVARITDGTHESFEIPLPDKTFVRLIDFNFYWGVTLRWAQQPDASKYPVFVPFMRPHMPPGQVFSGTLPEVVAQSIESVEQSGSVRDLTRYATRSRVVWVDEYDVPMKLQNVQANQIDVLQDYAHR